MRNTSSKKLYSILYRTFHVLLLIAMVLSGFGVHLGIHGFHISNLIYCFAFLTALLGISYGTLRGKIICSVGMLLILMTVSVPAGAPKAGAFWADYGNWLLGKNDWNAEWTLGYALVQSCLVTLFCYLFQIIAERLPILKEGTAVLLLGYLVWCMVSQKNVTKVTATVVLWYAILCLIEWTQRHWKKKKGDNHREYLLRLLPFCMLYLVLLGFMPASDEPYDWKFVKDAYYKMQEKFTVWIQDVQRGDREDFGVGKTGFSEEGRLMSRLIEDDRQLLTIQGSSGLMTNVYLVGKVYDTFDGSGWMQTVTGENDGQLLDTLETLYAIKRFDRELMEDYVYSTGLSVRYEYINTGHVFFPLKLQSLEGCEYTGSGSNLMFDGQKGYGTQYRAIYYQLNVDHPRFYEMAESWMADEDVLWKEVVKDYAPKAKRSLSLEDLTRYRQEMALNYGKEIILPEEVRAYLDQITKGKETKVEKLQAIEAALSEMTYTKKLDKIPETIENEGEFLSYFLLESKEGYCAYFATAFVLMARAEGIPARYVEGFCVPVTANKKMSITAQMAHAWPEVYLEGVGWIPFEPTPGYEEIRYTPWKLKSERGGTSLQEYEEELYAEEIPEEEVADEEITDGERKEEKRRNSGLIVVMIAFLLSVIIVYVLLDGFFFRRKYQRMSVQERFLVEVKRNEWLLLVLGFSRSSDETLQELETRVAEHLKKEPKIQFLQLYEAYLYGSHEITEEMLETTIAERSALLSQIKQERKWYYYIVLFRLGLGKRI